MVLPFDLADQLAAAAGATRQQSWTRIVHLTKAANFLELGVWKGEFAEHLLRACPTIERYTMLDSWRHLDNWNKPANVSQPQFDEIYSQAMARTDFARERRVVLRGRTLDVVDRIGDGTLDIAYVDGDHTLRGIAIDLIRLYPKIRPGGILGGDDFTPTIWQHDIAFEPSLVCPFAAYFAESQGAPIVLLPHNQFAIVKPDAPGDHFRAIDTTGRHASLSLLGKMKMRK